MGILFPLSIYFNNTGAFRVVVTYQSKNDFQVNQSALDIWHIKHIRLGKGQIKLQEVYYCNKKIW